MTAAVDLVPRFRYVRALVLGDVMLDTYLEGTADRLCSEGPVPVVRKLAEQHVPGGAANTAANLRALGAEVTLLGLIGRDVTGSLLCGALAGYAVDDAGLIEDPAAATLHKMRILADGQYVVRFDDEDTRPYSAQSRRTLLARLDDAFAHCDLVVFSDYDYGLASPALIARLRRLRSGRPVPLVVDSKALHRFRHAQSTVITPNHHEARLLVEYGGLASRPAGKKVAPLAEIERIGQRLLALIDAEHAAITLAGDGVLLVDRGGAQIHLPAHPVARAHDVGAGDSFAAALALALGAGATAVEAAQIGLDAAGIAVTKRWTAVVTQHELLQQVSLREHAAPAHDRADGTDVGSRRALARLARRLAVERQAGRTIVFTNGVFDILHAGHVELLRQARALGDLLVVGVNSDASARRLKGKNRPINGERNRLALVAALDPVDEAILFEEDTPEALIRALRPHIHVKGGDYADEALPEAEVVREVGGRVVILPLVGSLSTSGVIDRILTQRSERQAGVG